MRTARITKYGIQVATDEQAVALQYALQAYGESYAARTPEDHDRAASHWRTALRGLCRALGTEDERTVGTAVMYHYLDD